MCNRFFETDFKNDFQGHQSSEPDVGLQEFFAEPQHDNHSVCTVQFNFLMIEPSEPAWIPLDPLDPLESFKNSLESF